MNPSPEPVPDQSPLEACGACGTVLDLAELLPLTVVECPGCKSAITVLQRFGQYRLDGLLGTGGMGAVYKAFDVALQRHLALKILQRTWSHDAQLTAQFEKEAALTARVNHPNVVRVYSTGKAHGMFYIAMELVDRGSLDSEIEQKGRLPEVEVLQIGVQVAEGLEAATRAGLIHRDIKPGNILFSENRRAKIVDFGLALQSNQTEAALGEIWGTPFYVSPETLASKPEDFRSDMYALGSSLWHALTGSPPYPSTSTSVHELLHLKKKPVDLGTAFAGVHPRTVAVLNCTIAPEPGDRFPDYATLAAELRAALACLRPEDPPVPSRKHTPPSVGRRAGALILGVCVLGAGVLWWVKKRGGETEVQRAARAESALLSDEERLARACALIAHPGQMDPALRRLELISRSPDLRQDLQVWSAVALGTGYALRGEPARQASALEGLPEELAPPLRSFVQRLKTAASVSRTTSGDSSLAPEEQAVFLLWQALSKIAQDSPEAGLPLLHKASAFRVSGSPLSAIELLSVVPALARDVSALLSMEGEFRTPGRPNATAARIQQAESLQAATHPVLARSKRMSALLQSAKKEAPQQTSDAPQKIPGSEPAPASAAPVPSQPQPQPPPPPQKTATKTATPPALDPALADDLSAKVPLQILGFQFKGAREKASTVAAQTEPIRIQKTLVLRQADEVEALFRWCLQQINVGGTLPSPIMRNGATFKSDPIRADERTLFVKPDPTAPAVPIAWQEISPLFLVKMLQFRGSAVQNPAQRAELLWAAGSVHFLLGSKKNAADFYEEAAKLNPAYRAAIRELPLQ
jgi:serine/threonine protein kinase